MISVGDHRKHALYNICFRRAGVGIQWWDPLKAKSKKEWQTGLYIKQYHKDLKTAVLAETERLLHDTT